MSAGCLDSVSLDFAAGLDWIPLAATLSAGLECPLCPGGKVGSTPHLSYSGALQASASSFKEDVRFNSPRRTGGGQGG